MKTQPEILRTTIFCIGNASQRPWTAEMTTWIKALAVSPDTLSSVSETLLAAGEKQLPQMLFCILYLHVGIDTYIHISALHEGIRVHKICK